MVTAPQARCRGGAEGDLTVFKTRADLMGRDPNGIKHMPVRF